MNICFYKLAYLSSAWNKLHLTFFKNTIMIHASKLVTVHLSIAKLILTSFCASVSTDRFRIMPNRYCAYL